ncbi:thermonuclease family protein [Arenibaculum pallidiluteum]|uniref:thermonuclease family protein n=1 Tax=Arenibaculum pallidiluteum TaxID=2812559 RepID=UPI001A9686CA|nr:thermonuclease family protein [Arenibaculum pallidiluteum]
MNVPPSPSIPGTLLLAALALAAFGYAAPASAKGAEIVGVASVIDGDTLEIRGRRIRLHGVDAPESAQQCKDASGRPYRCGQKAALALADKIGRRNVRCQERDRDRYKRIVAVCRVGNEDLNAWLASEGLALAYRTYSRDYVAAEDRAKLTKAGLWAGEFQAPWDWRKKHRSRNSSNIHLGGNR